MPPVENSVKDLRELCTRHSELTTVTRVVDGGPEWVFDGGALRNTRADYFSIGLREANDGRTLLMMEQREPALVMVLVADIDGVRSVLLSLRTEPGLIGSTNFSSTIQSTPSNYLRRHGGKGTPSVEIAADPGSYGTVLYYAEQFDWGDYYVYKTKRFLIVEVPEPLPPGPGQHWVSVSAARQLLLQNHLITNDLRVILTQVIAPGRQPTVSGGHSTPDRTVLRTAADLDAQTVDSRGVGIVFCQTVTETREVSTWVQPLLAVPETLSITLACNVSGPERLFAVERRTQPGLLGQEVWFPAALPGSARTAVTTSAEGGRFWRARIALALQPPDATTGSGSDIEWLSAEEISTLVAEPLQTSLELRMAWSLVVAQTPDALAGS